jgi:tRNA (guanine-N7-)-methyltransferase
VTDTTPPLKNQPLKSYVIRASRLTEAQKKALDNLWDSYVLPFNGEPLDLHQAFSQSAPLIVEIGFGMGDSLLEMAIAAPDQNFLGIEVHRPGVGKLLHGIEAHNVSNLKIVCDDASQVVSTGLSPESIDRLLLYFPDPWHKKRHNKRRLVQHEFVQLVRQRLKIDAEFHMATDWEHYAMHMLEVMEAAAGFQNKNGEGCFWQDPIRPETKFERRGLKLGHGVWDLLYIRAD